MKELGILMALAFLSQQNSDCTIIADTQLDNTDAECPWV